MSESTSEAFEILDPIKFLQINGCVRQLQFDTYSVDSFIARRNSDSILFKPLRSCTQSHTQTNELSEIFDMDRRKRVYSLDFLSKVKSNF